MKTKTSLNLILTFLWLFSFNAVCVAKSHDKTNEATLVEATQVQLQLFKKRITVTGSLRASQGIVVKPEVAGRITQIYFTSGTFVRAGAPLIQLNKQVIAAKLQESQAELLLAKQNYEQNATLYKTHDVSKAMFDEVFAKYNEAAANVAGYQAQLDQTLITAPFSGKLGLAAINLGDYIDAGQKIVDLDMIDPIEVEFNVPETYLNYIGIGQAISASSDSYINQIFYGKIYALDSEINVNNRSIAARATIPNSDNKLLPGGFVEVNLDLVSKKPVLIIPQIAVFYDVDQTYVYKIVQNKAVKTKVTLSERDRENVVVLDGLNAGDVIVTAGQLNIGDGADVKIAPANASK